eukprot:762431-Hanusia_phi.AAC.4
MKLDEIYGAHGNCRPWKLFVNAFAQVFATEVGWGRGRASRQRRFSGVVDSFLGGIFISDTSSRIHDLSSIDPYHALPGCLLLCLFRLLVADFNIESGCYALPAGGEDRSKGGARGQGCGEDAMGKSKGRGGDKRVRRGRGSTEGRRLEVKEEEGHQGASKLGRFTSYPCRFWRPTSRRGRL